MSLSLQQASAALGNEGMRASHTGEELLKAKQLQFSVNSLLLAGVPWGDLFSKFVAIVAVVTGPGDWPTKIAAIFALFQKKVPEDITLP